jgi:signal transduction histidine kinase
MARHITIRRKLIAVMMVICIFSLITAGATFMAWNLRMYRQATADNLMITASIITNQMKAAVAFNDTKDAEKTLASLVAQPAIVAADVHTKDGKHFVAYNRDPKQPDAGKDLKAIDSGYAFMDGGIIVSQPIVLDGDRIGTVTILSDISQIQRMLKNSTQIVCGIILVVSVLGYFVALKMQGFISHPILSLADTAMSVSKDKDYSKRAERVSNDETGILIDAFNEMLNQVQGSQAELLEAKMHLEDKVQERTLALTTEVQSRKEAQMRLVGMNKDLAKAIEKLEQSNQQLQEFAYVASHDLREPLRKISSFGRLLQDSLQEKLTADDKENFEFMIDGAQRMQQMIEALLIYSRVTTHGAEFGPVDLNLIVEQLRTLELAAKLEEVPGSTIETPEPLPVVFGDPIQMRQLLQNLIVNGMKYQPKGAVPKIIVTATKTDDSMFRIDVTDNGIGIKEEYYNTIFTMFRRLHSRSEYEGTGIGLAVCKRIVERHNGKISLHSVVGKGTTFWFTVPASECPVTEVKAAVM